MFFVAIDAISRWDSCLRRSLTLLLRLLFTTFTPNEEAHGAFAVLLETLYVPDVFAVAAADRTLLVLFDLWFKGAGNCIPQAGEPRGR